MMAEKFEEKSLKLISDTNFIKFQNIITEPNFFKIVGRTHFERWHSCFWGWLLDPHGTHTLDYFVLNNILLSLLDEHCIKPNDFNPKQLTNILHAREYKNVEVRPNENDPSELSSKVGRFDIFLSCEVMVENNSFNKLNILFEMKIDTHTRKTQSEKYANWLEENHPDDINFLIYILPKNYLRSTPEASVGDPRWFCLDFQLLHDKLLLPIIGHPNINEIAKTFIEQYIKNLRIPYRGLKMALTDEEKELALQLYEKYNEVFDTIFEVLDNENKIDYSVTSSVTSSNRGSGRISVKIDGQVFNGDSVSSLYSNALKYLVDNNKLDKLALPWGTGTRRYIISNDKNPIHPSGRDFFSPVAYKGFILEAHVDRVRGVSHLEQLSTKLGLKFELLEV